MAHKSFHGVLVFLLVTCVIGVLSQAPGDQHDSNQQSHEQDHDDDDNNHGDHGDHGDYGDYGDHGDDDDGDLSTGAIAGICIGVMLIVVLVVLIIIVSCKKHNKATVQNVPRQQPLVLPPPMTTKSKEAVILGVQGYPHEEPSYSHNMNPYYFPSPGEKYLAPPIVVQAFPGVSPDGAVDVEATGLPSYDEATTQTKQ